MSAWRRVEGWPYEVSNRGQVRRCEPSGLSGRHRAISSTYIGKILKAGLSKGYPAVTLCKNGQLKTKKIHTLVCTAFNGPRPSALHQIRHLDGNPLNNTPTNLVWGLAIDNAIDRDMHGTTKRGASCSRAKFSQSEVNELRRKYKAERLARIKAGYKRVRRGFVQQLATNYQVSENTIFGILTGKGYKL